MLSWRPLRARRLARFPREEPQRSPRLLAISGPPEASVEEALGAASHWRSIARLVAVSDHFVDGAVAASLLAELAVLFGNVVVRAVFNYAFVWSLEVAQLALATLTFVGGAVAYRRNEHMHLRVLVDRLPVPARKFLSTISDLTVVCVCLTAGAYSIPLLRDDLPRRMQVLDISEAWTVAPMTVGLALFAYYAIRRVFRLPWRSVLPAVAVVATAVVVMSYTHEGWSQWLDASDVLWLTFAAFVLLLLIGLPLGFVLAMAALLYVFASGTTPLTFLPISMNNGVTSFVLLALPFFILAGFIMAYGGLSPPLATFASVLVGRLRGGLLHVIIVSTFLFSGLSGSKVADVAAVGATMRDMLETEGYDLAESTAVLAASAAAGETIPPSLAMLVLGSITTISISSLFAAGIVPAAVISLLLMSAVVIRGGGKSAIISGSYRAELVKAGVRAIPPLLLPVILIGGIIGGIATPTEVSSFAVVYGILLAVAVYRALDLRGFWSLAVSAASTTGMILFIVSTASAFSWSLTIAGVPRAIGSGLISIGHYSIPLFFLCAIVVLIVVGAVLEGLPALLIFGPLLVPVAGQLGINTLHFAIVLTVAMGIGTFAPPIGIGLYVSCAVMNTSLERVSRPMLPYIGVLLLALLLITLVPQLSLALPSVLPHR